MKCCRKRIANDSKDKAMMHFDGLVQDDVVARKQFRHLFGMLLREFRAAFNISEEEGDSTGGELILVSHLNNDYDIGTLFWK